MLEEIKNVLDTALKNSKYEIRAEVLDQEQYLNEKELCTRCGTCFSFCPTQAIQLDRDFYPFKIFDRCISCNLCSEVCPGLGLNFPELYMEIFDKEYELGKKIGFFKDIYVGKTLNEKIKDQSTSGGVITCLLIYLLEEKMIDGAIVVGFDNNKKWLPKVLIAKSPEEILNASQSKYAVVPVNSILRELIHLSGKYAFVGLPCHVHGLRKAMKINKTLNEKISIIFGLYCGGVFEKEATDNLISKSNIKKEKINKIEYRGGKWPGNFILWYDNKKFEIGKYVYDYLRRIYYPKRCLYCIDYSNEFSDISFADAWMKDKNGEYVYEDGRTLILVRTRSGSDLFKEILNKKLLQLEKINPTLAFESHTSGILEHKKWAVIRLSKKEGGMPDYHIKFPNFSKMDKLKLYLIDLTFIIGTSDFLKSFFTLIILSPFTKIFSEKYKFLKKLFKYKLRGVLK